MAKKKKKTDNIVPHYPIHSRPPNKLIGYVYKEFCDTTGENGGQVRVAIYSDKNKEIKSMDAQIIWKYGWYSGVSKEEYYGYNKEINNKLFKTN